MGRRLHIQAQSGEVNEIQNDGGEGIPASAGLVSSQILNMILSEGCKFGVAETLISSVIACFILPVSRGCAPSC